MADTSFAASYQSLAGLAQRVAYRVAGDPDIASDVAAETLGRAWANWSRIRQPPAWVAQVAARLAIEHQRGANRTLPPAGRPGNVDPDPDGRLDLARALKRLPRRQRQVVVLRYLADLPETAIASALGVNITTVHSHSQTGLAALRRHLNTADLPPVAPQTR